jgi:hypothetical protein
MSLAGYVNLLLDSRLHSHVAAQEIPLNIHVTTGERKTSANLLGYVRKDLQYLKKLGAILCAFTCDSGGDSRGLRPLLLAEMPEILTIPCWAHQVRRALTPSSPC